MAAAPPVPAVVSLPPLGAPALAAPAAGAPALAAPAVGFAVPALFPVPKLTGGLGSEFEPTQQPLMTTMLTATAPKKKQLRPRSIKTTPVLPHTSEHYSLADFRGPSSSGASLRGTRDGFAPGCNFPAPTWSPRATAFVSRPCGMCEAPPRFSRASGPAPRVGAHGRATQKPHHGATQPPLRLLKRIGPRVRSLPCSKRRS
jgi:hypothetical protein